MKLKEIDESLLRRCLVAAACLALAAGWFGTARSGPPEAQLAFRGTIYTGNPDAPRAGALAVRDGLIVYLGDEAGLAPHVGRKTRVIDLGAAALYPGFSDAHARLYDNAWMSTLLDLRGTTSFEDAVRRVARAVRQAPPNGWLLGWGWDQNDWVDGAYPRSAQLQPVTQTQAVCLFSRDGHGAVLNRAAMEQADIDDEAPDPPGGRFVRMHGNPTGLLVDRALDDVWKVLPDPSPEEVETRFRAGADSAVSYGWTAAREMGLTGPRLAALETIAKKSRKAPFPLRLYGVVDGQQLSDTTLVLKPPAVWPADSRIDVSSVGWTIDGVFALRGAALEAPYSDEDRQLGGLSGTAMDFAAPIRAAVVAGWQPVLEASGELGVTVALAALDTALVGLPLEQRNAARATLERAVMIPPAELERLTRLGVTVVVLPGQLPEEMRWLENRLSTRRMKGVEEWKTLLDAQAQLAFGTDGPSGPADPVVLFYHAVTRQNAAGRPAGGWYGEQKLSRAEALTALTSGAAMAGRRPEGAGTLGPGRPADLTVLTRDIMSVPDNEILTAHAQMTIVGGDIVYERPNRP